MLLAAAEWFRVPVRWNRYTHRGEKSPIPYYREPSDRSFFPTPRPQNPLRGGQPRREVFLYGSLFLSVPLEYSHKEQHHPECSYRSEPGSSRIRQNFQLCIHLKSSHHPSDWRKEYHPAKFLHGDIFFQFEENIDRGLNSIQNFLFSGATVGSAVMNIKSVKRGF